ncbi:MAG: helix-turn-helix transcriptional regulator [Spirochaetes bacterium]|nr:helix-turn-helix transcriptional regulator [Spirochaetota bacterium]
MNNKEKIPVDAIFSAARDKYGDVLGILIIGNELKGLKQLKLFFKITTREAEIIQELVDGFTNTNIADHLGISENTLKRHIANIYLKLEINNKVELLNFLKDFNLIPSFKAERTLLRLNKEDE